MSARSVFSLLGILWVHGCIVGFFYLLFAAGQIALAVGVLIAGLGPVILDA